MAALRGDCLAAYSAECSVDLTAATRVGNWAETMAEMKVGR